LTSPEVKLPWLGLQPLTFSREVKLPWLGLQSLTFDQSREDHSQSTGFWEVKANRNRFMEFEIVYFHPTFHNNNATAYMSTSGP
jgi:hypothetical protein